MSTAPDFLAECPPRIPKGRLHKVECEGCGYVGRVTAKWLDRYGAPLCPCNGDPMRDCRPLELLPREALEVDDQGEGELVQATYVKLRCSAHCGFCGRFHEPGDVMVSARVRTGNGRAPWGRYCCDCRADTQREIGGMVPSTWPNETGFGGAVS